jgi:hypothetical protein
MGHYAFGELSLGLKFKLQIERELINRLGTALNSPERLQVVERLAFWTEEVFCDLFAVRLVGFCYSLAFVELFDVSTVLDENSVFSPLRSTGKTEFLQYPPDLFRLRQQVSVLTQDGWWPGVQRIDSHYVRALETAAVLKETDFGFTELRSYFSAIDPADVLAAFFAIIPQLINELNTITAGLNLGTDDWTQTDENIALYLQNAIVPSSIRSGALNDIPRFPEPTSLLNASYKCYLEGMDPLLSNIKGADMTSKDDRAKWASKIEMWTGKVVEDVMLMTRRIT